MLFTLVLLILLLEGATAWFVPGSRLSTIRVFLSDFAEKNYGEDPNQAKAAPTNEKTELIKKSEVEKVGYYSLGLSCYHLLPCEHNNLPTTFFNR